MYEASNIEDAAVVVVSYGITSRVAQRAVGLARNQGLPVGNFRLLTVWPFPEQQIGELAKKAKVLVVPELNLGQMVLEVERAAAGACRVKSVPHAGGGVHLPEDILRVIVETAQ
jgi:2-oxoglutarate ferredoxin oxidoreductase subunit alpha